MSINWKQTLGAAVLSASMFGAGAAFTQPAAALTRGETASSQNIVRVEARLARLIGQLNNDQADYGGHRVAAIGYLQQADNQLHQAISWDATHNK